MAAEATFLVPKWLFKNSDGSPCEIKNKVVGLGTGSANASVIAAVTGRQIRVLELTIASDAAAAIALMLKDGSGGTSLMKIADASTSASHRVVYPLDPHGHLDTSNGIGLFADTGASCAVTLSLRYIEFS